MLTETIPHVSEEEEEVSPVKRTAALQSFPTSDIRFTRTYSLRNFYDPFDRACFPVPFGIIKSMVNSYELDTRTTRT